MLSDDWLIDRTALLPRGLRVELTVTSWYSVPIDDEILDEGEEAVTFDELVVRLGGSRFESRAVDAVIRHFDEVDHEGEFGIESPSGDYRRFRFAWPYEQGTASRERFVTLEEIRAPRGET